MRRIPGWAVTVALVAVSVPLAFVVAFFAGSALIWGALWVFFT